MATRLTLDIDLVIRLAPREHATFAALWDPAEFYCPPVEAIAAQSARETHGHFNVIHSESAMRADVYIAPDDAITTWESVVVSCLHKNDTIVKCDVNDPMFFCNASRPGVGWHPFEPLRLADACERVAENRLHQVHHSERGLAVRINPPAEIFSEVVIALAKPRLV